jgi:hypothetical protein
MADLSAFLARGCAHCDLSTSHAQPATRIDCGERFVGWKKEELLF